MLLLGKPPGPKEGILPADISSVQPNEEGQGMLPAGLSPATSPMARVRCPQWQGLSAPGGKPLGQREGNMSFGHTEGEGISPGRGTQWEGPDIKHSSFSSNGSSGIQQPVFDLGTAHLPVIDPMCQMPGLKAPTLDERAPVTGITKHCHWMENRQ